MDTALQNAVSAPFLRQFLAVRVVLNSGSIINLIDGSGYVSFPIDGQTVTFTGVDPTFGTLASATSVSEQIVEESPQFTFSILPPDELALGTLNDPLQQGSRVSVYWGLVNEDTGMVIGSPELMWLGRLDTVKTNVGPNALTAEIATVSAFDRLFTVEEGQRLNGEWHRSIWPGETGLDYVYDATTDIYWGVEAPSKPAVSSYAYKAGSGSGLYDSE